MENKYYTPDISEFHVGFEYEAGTKVIGNNLQWNIEEFKPEHFNVLDYINNNKDLVRVKYLDKKDIESLGWKIIEDIGMAYNYGNMFKIIGGSTYRFEYMLRIWYPKHDFYPGMRVEITGHLLNANFYIKNKLELKKLMQQLNII